MKWYRKAAEQGYAAGEYSLALSYSKGEGMPLDYEKAFELFSKSAQQGYTNAQLYVGNCYAQGRGTSIDYTAASKWYRMAAEKGDSLAQYALSDLYFKGLGVNRDHVLAYMWANLSSASSNKDAVRFRNLLEASMTEDEINEAQKLSREWKPILSDAK